MQMKNGLDMEIWNHKRFVIRLTAQRPRGVPDGPPNKKRPKTRKLENLIKDVQKCLRRACDCGRALKQSSSSELRRRCTQKAFSDAKGF